MTWGAGATRSTCASWRSAAASAGTLPSTYVALFPDDPGGVILAKTTGGDWTDPRVIEGRLQA